MAFPHLQMAMQLVQTLALIALVLACTMEASRWTASAQSFQYSKGWQPGKRTAIAHEVRFWALINSFFFSYSSTIPNRTPPPKSGSAPG